MKERLVKFEDIGKRDYKETWDYQEDIFNGILKNKSLQGKEAGNKASLNRLIFVEHPHVYTLGKSGSEDNLLLNYIQLKAKDASFHKIDRGGDITYHGPGQIVGYPIFDLDIFNVKLKEYIYYLEEAIILTLKEFGLRSDRLAGATGVWLDNHPGGRTRKISAIGVKASRYVTMHGFAFNVNTSLDYFDHINPCGYTDKGVTSLEKEMGEKQDMEKVKSILREKLQKVFGIKWVNHV